MQQIYAYDDITPVIDATAFVHDAAVVIGDVLIGPGCYVGPGAVLRGDFGRIQIGEGSNVQETCVIHSFPDQDVILERDSHIGHGAVLHGCHICENVLIGMNAVVMDNAIIGKDCIVGALAFIKAGTEFAPGQMIAGSPARILRPLTEQEIDWKRRGTGVYQNLARLAPEKLERTEPLRHAPDNRRRVTAPKYDPLVIERRNTAEKQDT